MTKTILHIDASIGGAASRSRQASARIASETPGARIIRRDLAASPLPQIGGIWAEARLIPPKDRNNAAQAALALSDKLVAELQAADHIVIGLPIYNFGMPASLKAWVDLVARLNVTFRYTSSGPEGLLAGKTATVVVASGGTAIGSAGDFASTHLTHVLRFLGIADVTVIAATDIVAANAA